MINTGPLFTILFPLAAAFLNLRLLTQIGVYDGGNSFHGLQEDGRQGLHRWRVPTKMLN